MSHEKLQTRRTTSNTLDQIGEAAIDALGSVGSSVRHWKWRDNVLVFEYTTTSGMRFAYDLIHDNAEYVLKIVGRDEATKYMILKRLQRVSSGIKGQPHRFVAKWPETIPTTKLTLEIVALIQHATSLLEYREQHPTRYIPGYWWDLRENFGDQMGAWLIELLTGRPAYNTMGRADAKYAIMTVGSIVTGMYRPGMSIWGSGLIAPLQGSTVERLRKCQPKAIHALRGELTQTSISRELNWDVPTTLGDPALVLPLLFKPTEVPKEHAETSVIPHYIHRDIIANNPRIRDSNIIDVRKPPEIVVSQIAQSKAVISTSLHGLIVAQAYGVPWVWLNITDKQLVGNEYKFEDFFTTIERDEVQQVDIQSDELKTIDIQQIARQATLPRSRYDAEALLNAFRLEEIQTIAGEYLKPERIESDE